MIALPFPEIRGGAEAEKNEGKAGIERHAHKASLLGEHAGAEDHRQRAERKVQSRRAIAEGERGKLKKRDRQRGKRKDLDIEVPQHGVGGRAAVGNSRLQRKRAYRREQCDARKRRAAAQGEEHIEHRRRACEPKDGQQHGKQRAPRTEKAQHGGGNERERTQHGKHHGRCGAEAEVFLHRAGQLALHGIAAAEQIEDRGGKQQHERQRKRRGAAALRQTVGVKAGAQMLGSEKSRSGGKEDEQRPISFFHGDRVLSG